MNTQSYLSSYAFRMGLTCPTRLYYEYKSEYPTNQQDRAIVDHIRFNKQQLVSLAQGLYPRGIQVTSRDREAAANETKRVLGREDEVVLFDAVLICKNLYHRIPILKKEADKLHLYEIRTKAINPAKHRFVSKKNRIHGKWLSSFLDLAFAQYIADQLFDYSKIHTHLVLPDKTGRASVNLQDYFSTKEGRATLVEGKALKNRRDKINILSFHQVDEWTRKIIKGNTGSRDKHPAWRETDFVQQIRQMSEMIRKPEKYPPVLDMHCRKCPFRVARRSLGDGELSGFDECWSEQVEEEALLSGFHIFNLIGHGTENLLDEEHYTLDQVPLTQKSEDAEQILDDGDRISYADRQNLQILKAKGYEIPLEFGKTKLFEELDQLSFPLFFLDFEAANMAVPFKAGSKPYESLIFQWSCHVFSRDQTLRHYDWIQDKPGKYPNYEFVRSLLNIPDLHTGTVVQYSPFEKQMIKDVRRIIKSDIKQGYAPADAAEWEHELDKLLEGNRHQSPVPFLDMNRLVKDYYYHRKMNGSLSLKDVIAAVMKTSKTLRAKYSEEYKSRNFRGVYWWQKENKEGEGRDPYDIIEEKGEGISQGSEALMAFIKLQNKELPDSDRQSVVDALLKYCELDTLSMVMLYQHWREMES